MADRLDDNAAASFLAEFRRENLDADNGLFGRGKPLDHADNGGQRIRDQKENGGNTSPVGQSQAGKSQNGNGAAE